MPIGFDHADAEAKHLIGIADEDRVSSGNVYDMQNSLLQHHSFNILRKGCSTDALNGSCFSLIKSSDFYKCYVSGPLFRRIYPSCRMES